MIFRAIEARLRGVYGSSEYPALADQIMQWGREQPLDGMSVLDATPIFRNTMVKYMALLAAGADLMIGVSDKIPHDTEVLDFLRSIDVKILTNNDLQECDLILDCAAAFAHFPAKRGYVELTRSGIDGYAACQKPVFMADSGRVKRIETSLGTGESYFRAMRALGYDDWNGKRLVVFGSGKVGKGIIAYGKNIGAQVFTVTDPQTIAGDVYQVIDFKDIEAVKNIVSNAYAVVSATGIVGSLAPFAQTMDCPDALIANMGVEDEFGADLPDNRVLNGKKPLNFMLEEPTLIKYIDATMALHNCGAVYLVKTQNLPVGIINPPADMEDKLLQVTRDNGLITNELDLV